ncbi:hypothetical protein [Arenibacter troitsensis]|uniref:SGNH/GDSL hydrolase family protein n=1 Tax=Arenibacter troitsensis TaxID=188872 RepID=A0A1X7IYH6_9FLAO|nr:hypothetical protein [Arenibacter troitsensis]SMG20200.1 hypothetical protein SAMN03080602_01288 [Arenibacter troitsensis]
MTKFIKLLVHVMVFGTVAIFIILTILEKTLFEDSETLPHEKVTKFYSSNRTVKLLILGSSRGEGDFIPSILETNRKGYNFGLPGTGNKIWYYMLLDELDNSISRKVIVSIDLTEYPIQEGEDYNYNYYLKLPKNTHLYASLETSTKTKILPYPFFYFGNLKGFVSESLKDYINLTTITENGFKGNTNVLSTRQFETISSDVDSINIRFNEKLWLDTFERISKSNDTVYFVLAPTFHSYLKHLDYSNFKNNMQELSQKYSKVKFYDFSNSIHHRKLFYDPIHLNYNGAITFSEMLRDSIKKE